MRFKRKWIIGYAILPVFKIRTLENASEAEFICNGFWSWVFDWFFSPFWNGAIHVTGEMEEEVP